MSADDIHLRGIQTESGRDSDSNSGGGLGDQLENIERRAIIDALEQARYNKTRAAKLLGMSFRSLRYRIKKLGIE